MLAPNTLWRPTPSSTRNDRDLIRTYLGWPVTEGSLVELTQQMNSVATLSPSTVGQVQGWLDEIVNLEETQADEVDAGTAHLGSAEEYEGPIPGSNARASAQGQRDERIQLLINRIATALNVPRIAPQAAMGAGMLLRS